MPWGSFEGVTYSVSASVNSDKKGCTVLFYKNIFLYIASLSLSQPDLQAGFFICWFLSPIFPKISRRLFSQQLYTAYKSQNIYKIFADPLCLWTNWIGTEINIKESGIIIPWIILLYKIIRYYETKKEQRKKPLLFYYFCTTKPETPLTKIYSVFAVFKLWRYWWRWWESNSRLTRLPKNFLHT